MKSKIVSCFALALCICQLTQAQQPFKVSGNIKNIPDPEYVYIAKNWRDMDVQDSVKVKNGGFSYAGTSGSNDPVQAFMYVGFKDPQKAGKYVKRMVTDFYIENANIRVDINGQAFRDSSVVTGSKTNNDYRTFRQMKAANEQLMAKLLDSMKTAAVPQQQATQIYKERLSGFYYNFVRQFPNSFISLQVLSTELWRLEKPENIAKLFKELPQQLQQLDTGKELEELLASATRIRIDMMAPEFTEKDTNGIAVPLSSFRGKYVLVDFWASWCHPCRDENPYLLKAYQRFKDKNFTILSVSMDNSRNAWLKAIQTDKLEWQQISALDPAKSESALKYGVKSIPRNFLIDPNGRIIAMDLRKEAIAEKLQSVLN